MPFLYASSTFYRSELQIVNRDMNWNHETVSVLASLHAYGDLVYGNDAVCTLAWRNREQVALQSRITTVQMRCPLDVRRCL